MEPGHLMQRPVASEADNAGKLLHTLGIGLGYLLVSLIDIEP